MNAGRRAAPMPGALRLVAALAVALGLFGMYGLAHHCAAHSAHPASASHDIHGTGHDGSHNTSHTSGHTSNHSDSHTGGELAGDLAELALSPAADPGLAGMVMMCVAMLAAVGLIAAFVRLLRRGDSSAPRRTSRPPNPNLRWLLAAGVGPPPTWRFSVIRC